MRIFANLGNYYAIEEVIPALQRCTTKGSNQWAGGIRPEHWFAGNALDTEGQETGGGNYPPPAQRRRDNR